MLVSEFKRNLNDFSLHFSLISVILQSRLQCNTSRFRLITVANSQANGNGFFFWFRNQLNRFNEGIRNGLKEYFSQHSIPIRLGMLGKSV